MTSHDCHELLLRLRFGPSFLTELICPLLTSFTLCAFDGYGLRDHMPARPALTPQIRFLYIGSRVCSTLLSDPASRRRPCASLSLHLHQVVKRTFTFELLNMLGTHEKAEAIRRLR